MARFLGGGYQLRVGVCVSGTFGLPQNRARTILFGARRGERLPHFPTPTHQLPPVPISMMTTWMKAHLLNVPSKEQEAQLAKPLTLRDAFSDLPSIKAITREFGTNKGNHAPKETAAKPYRAIKYAGRTSAGGSVGPASIFQQEARAGCVDDELHDHEAFILNDDDQARATTAPPLPARRAAITSTPASDPLPHQIRGRIRSAYASDPHPHQTPPWAWRHRR